MKSYIVFGLGRFGRSVATSLYHLGKEVLAVDIDEEIIADIQNDVTHAVIGDCTDEHVLQTLGVRNFDVAIVAAGEDIQNSTLTTVLLKEMGAKYIISRAVDDIHARILTKVGADRIIMPERDMGERLAKSVASSNILDMLNLSDDYSIAELTVQQNWADKTIGQLNLRSAFGISVLAVKRENEIKISPTAEFTILKNDIVFVIGLNSDIDKLKE